MKSYAKWWTDILGRLSRTMIINSLSTSSQSETMFLVLLSVVVACRQSCVISINFSRLHSPAFEVCYYLLMLTCFTVLVNKPDIRASSNDHSPLGLTCMLFTYLYINYFVHGFYMAHVLSCSFSGYYFCSCLCLGYGYNSCSCSILLVF